MMAPEPSHPYITSRPSPVQEAAYAARRVGITGRFGTNSEPNRADARVERLISGNRGKQR